MSATIPLPLSILNTFITMSSATADERLTHHDNSLVHLNRTLQDILLHLEEIQTNISRPDHVNVLPSASNPTSKTSRLSDLERDLPPVPLQKLQALSHCVRPANPSEFSGNHMKGHTFLNSCNLYFALMLFQFPNDHAKILWAFSL
jgi:hypothetical protein